MRSQGQVRFIKISSKIQMTGAACAAALLLGWAGSMSVMAWSQYQAEAELASFEQDKAKVASAQERIDAYGNDLERVIDELDERQKFLDAMLPMLPEEIRDAGVNVTDSSQETTETVKKVGAMVPQARGLAEVEARQLAFVERITRFADYRARKAEEAMRKLDLDPRAMTRNASAAIGGPLEVLATSTNGDLDPRFERLGLSLARMAALERALEGIPQVVPAGQNISSGFGYRRDPFTGGGAMHSGIDFKGPVGSPIYAAAKGVVTFAGWKSGYGKVIEIRHGNGMMTRYAHMSRFSVAVGQSVEAGATIGGIGSTGRSTGPHLHFEVRINERPVNPRKFLEAAPDVLKEVRGAGSARPTTTAIAG
ncbi:peptidoglycan DD-metalloendopeptidase family protein [Erythrobacter sp. JK5]|uniref:peptidoglycan DD-metalloendopeptidase family protein n=1 Tax=Erythrobacter sp. JK5 TaxID=2829500 RepID=UPI001BA46049|nr:peptidoglycan DD-metalloendopeptidase family protein [Erythrobacter sp. JK5]QUL37307.1 peptidoglycan DD-metalloendopeptidase family protein [Erythrobacter sp. JK5]